MAFPQPPAGLASVALVPLLRNKRLIGSLNLGSRDPSRFTPLLGTDFVEHMGSIIAICLENVISNEMLKYIGLTDALTGVYNRRYMDRRLVEEIARARRQAYRLSCMYIDIDHFKQVNDTHGHQAGDDVLREVAARIKAELRMSDALGRFGGEEFVVLLIDADLDSASMVAAAHPRQRGRPALPAAGRGDGWRCRCRSAWRRSDDVERDQAIEDVAQQLVAQADQALYQAKERGPQPGGRRGRPSRSAQRSSRPSARVTAGAASRAAPPRRRPAARCPASGSIRSLPRRTAVISAPDLVQFQVGDAAADRAGVLAQRHRMQAHVAVLVVVAEVAGAVEEAAQRGVALVARGLHPVHHAAQRHAHHHQRVRGQHQARFQRFRHHLGGAGAFQHVEFGVVVGAHDHRQLGRQLVHQVQHLQRQAACRRR